jgi:hypothetical protein
MWLITAGKVWRLMACRERHGRQRVVGIEPGSMRIGNSRQDWHGWKAPTGTGRQAWGAWPFSFWLGRHGVARPYWAWLFSAGVARSGFSFNGRHGRNGSESRVSARCDLAGSAQMGKDSTVPNGMAGKASHADAGRLSHGRQRSFWIGLERMARQEWHSTAGPVIAGDETQRIVGPLVARQAAQCSSRSGNAWQAVQRSARQHISRQAPHDTEHSAPKAGKVWPLWKASNGRPGLDGQPMRGRSGRRFYCQTAA